MVVAGVESRVLFIGLSSDSKPAGSVDLGAKFYEHDTGVTYIWIGTNWVEYLPLYPVGFDPALTTRN